MTQLCSSIHLAQNMTYNILPHKISQIMPNIEILYTTLTLSEPNYNMCGINSKPSLLQFNTCIAKQK